MLVLRSKPQGAPGSSPHIRSISKPHWFYFPNLPRICPLFTTFSATTLTGSHHLLHGPEQSPAPSSLGSHPPYSPLPPCSFPSKSDLPQRLEGACEHLSHHVPLLRTFHGSHLTWDKSPRPSCGPKFLLDSSLSPLCSHLPALVSPFSFHFQPHQLPCCSSNTPSISNLWGEPLAPRWHS